MNSETDNASSVGGKTAGDFQNSGAGGGRRGALDGFLVRLAVVTALVLVLLLLWYAVNVLMLVFAGILLAVFLRGLSGAVSRSTKLPEGWSLAIVIVGILLVVGGLIWWLAPQIAEQAAELRRVLPESIRQGEERLAEYGWGRQIIERMPTVEEAMPNGADAFSRVTGIFSSTLSYVVNFVIIVFVGIYLAIGGRTYTNGLVRLFPFERRARAREVVNELGFTLWWWLVGKIAAMIVVGVLTWLFLMLLGVPLSITLGLLAGLLDFIPNIGPFLAGIPAVLIALTVSPTVALYVLIFYFVVQSLESYVLTPILQQKTVKLPPAITVVAQVLLGVLIGGIGLILASPLAAVAFVLVRMLYLEDTLGERIVKPSEESEDEEKKDEKFEKTD
jgi:predicted PurR-regulated permease PerM